MRPQRDCITPLPDGLNKREEGSRDFLLKEMPKQSVCAEIGVYKGEFSERILRIVRPQELHLIDPWKYEPSATYREAWFGGEQGASQANMDSIYDGVLRRFQVPIAKGTIAVHRAASLEASFAFPDGYFDWIYIDGNHLYEYVKMDLERYYPKVKHGGYLAGDDYAEGCWWQGGVKRAVDEFVRNGLVELLQIKNSQFWLRKGPLVLRESL
jgi:hypothetical protein